MSREATQAADAIGFLEVVFHDGSVRSGRWIGVSVDEAVVQVEGEAPFSPRYFHLLTGKHLTWGQGYFQYDEWPTLTKASLDKIQGTVVW